MTTVLLILAALILPLTMTVVSVCMNELEKSTKLLGEMLAKRYTIEPKKPAETDSAVAKMLKGKAKT